MTLFYIVDGELTMNRRSAVRAATVRQPVTVRFGLDGPEVTVRPVHHDLQTAPRRNTRTGRILPVIPTAAHSSGTHWMLRNPDGRTDVLRVGNPDAALLRAENNAVDAAAGQNVHRENGLNLRPL